MTALAKLRERWRGDGQALAREAVSRLITGHGLADLELGEIDGRTDLRGLWLASSRGLPGLPSDPLATVPTAHRVRWHDLDMSGSTFRIEIADSTLTNVLFNRAAWLDWRVTSSVLQDCRFVAADVRGTSFDGYNSGLQDRALAGKPSRYLRCDFTRTRLGPYSQWGRAIVEDCHFVDTKFTSPMWFLGAQLHRCVFEGSFRTVCFGWAGRILEPPPWLDVDTSHADFDSLEVYTHSGPGLRRSP